MNSIKTVCVFCASSPDIDPFYCRVAQSVGEILASHNIKIKYGGGTSGLMEHLAKGALSHHGSVTGIIPDFMQSQKSTHAGITKMVVVSSMQERKRLMRENADAIIALPGGTGTLEELLEVITLKRLGFFPEPIVILNCNNYYAYFLAFFNKMIEEKFLGPRYQNIFSVVDRPGKVITAARYTPKWALVNDCPAGLTS